MALFKLGTILTLGGATPAARPGFSLTWNKNRDPEVMISSQTRAHLEWCSQTESRGLAPAIPHLAGFWLGSSTGSFHHTNFVSPKLKTKIKNAMREEENRGRICSAGAGAREGLVREKEYED